MVNPTIKPCGLGSTADVLVEAQSPDAVVAQFVHLRVFVFPCVVVLSFFLHLSHALTIHIDLSVPSRLKSQHHAVASLNKSLTFQCHRILEHNVFESTCKEIAHGGGAVIQ